MIKIILSHDFRHTAINQLWRLFSGPLLLILIPLYLSAEIQGYWYTFISLAALAIFADMGFSTILLQFSAHEFAHLKFESNKTLSGSKKNLYRMSSLLKFSMKWSASMGIITFPIILIVGFLILNEKETYVNWMIPWLIYAIASIFVFINSMLLSFIEGCNSVGDIQKIRFSISVVIFISTVLLIIFGAELYALVISLCIGSVGGTALILYRYKSMLKQLYKLDLNTTHNWKQEILPLLGKYAISWISGYFIFYLFTPVAFHYYGVIEAGKIGLTVAVFTAIFGISNIWITIIVPKINIFVSHKDYKSLNKVFEKHIFYGIGTYIIGVIILFLITIIFGKNLPFDERLVNSYSLYIISFGWLMQIIINSLAVYMRAHKKEPLVVPSLFAAIYISFTTLYIANNYESQYIFLGFSTSFIWLFPWVTYIFITFKKENHNYVE